MVPRRMEDIDEFGQRLECGGDAGTGTICKGGLEWERPRAFSVGDYLGGTRTVAPFKNGIGAAESSDFELDLPDWVKGNMWIAWDSEHGKEISRSDRRWTRGLESLPLARVMTLPGPLACAIRQTFFIALGLRSRVS